MIALHRAYEFSAISGWSKTSTLLTTNIRTDAVYNSIPLTNLPQSEDSNPDEFGAFLGAKFAMTAGYDVPLYLALPIGRFFRERGMSRQTLQEFCTTQKKRSFDPQSSDGGKS